MTVEESFLVPNLASGASLLSHAPVVERVVVHPAFQAPKSFTLVLWAEHPDPGRGKALATALFRRP